MATSVSKCLDLGGHVTDACKLLGDGGIFDHDSE